MANQNAPQIRIIVEGPANSGKTRLVALLGAIFTRAFLFVDVVTDAKAKELQDSIRDLEETVRGLTNVSITLVERRVSKPAEDAPDTNKLREAAEKIVRLTDNPEPGCFSWHKVVHDLCDVVAEYAPGFVKRPKVRLPGARRKTFRVLSWYHGGELPVVLELHADNPEQARERAGFIIGGAQRLITRVQIDEVEEVE